MQKTKILPHLFCMLSSVQSMSLHDIFWNDWPLDFRHSIKSILRLPSFMRLELDHCWFASLSCLTSLICSCSALKHLHLYDLHIGCVYFHYPKEDDLHVGQINQCYRLDVLLVHLCNQPIITDWLLDLQGPIDVTNIDTLHVGGSTNPGTYTALSRVIDSAGHSLRQLTLWPHSTVNQGGIEQSLIMFVLL
jgi:hypothetical protein